MKKKSAGNKPSNKRRKSKEALTVGAKKNQRAAGPVSMNAVYGLDLSTKGPHTLGLIDVKQAYETKPRQKGRFPGCGCPPVHLVRLQLADFPELPDSIRQFGILDVVYSSCEECDPEDFITFAMGKRLSPVGESGPGDCDPGNASPSTRETFVSFTRQPKDTRAAIRIGGEPRWIQNRDDWADCDSCGQKPFFVGQMERFQLPPGAEGPAYELYVFVCAKCRLQTIVKQMT